MLNFRGFDRGVIMFRKILIASTAIVAMGSAAYAADLPTTKGPAVYTPPPPIFTWTGFYAGGQFGYEWGRVYPRFSTPFTTDGIDGGGHVGYNYQFGQFVAGLKVTSTARPLMAAMALSPRRCRSTARSAAVWAMLGIAL